MDTDGTISARGRSSFTTTSDRLAQDVYELVVGLGIEASRRERPAKLYGRTCGTSYDIGFTAYDDQPVFRLLRKRDRLRTRGAGRPGDSGGRRIVSVEPVPTRPVRCIQVDSPSHLYLAGESMIPTHNTEVVMNYLGSRIHKDPGPTMVVQPTLKKAQGWSKTRLAPMLRDSKALRGKVADARTRDSGNTTLQKTYTGGLLTIVGANSAADLSSDPIRDFLGDEIDRYPASAGTEGDPLSLGIQRTRNFWNRKVLLPALHLAGERTLTLRLSNAVSSVIDDGVATGTIVRESELPKAWLARFGRTASDHAAQAIARRLEAGRRETQVTVAGRRVDGLSVDGLLSGALPSGGWRPASAVEDMATRLAAPALAASGAPFGGVDADPGTPGLRAGTWGGAPGALDREPSADAGQTLRRAVLPDFGFRLPDAEEALLGTSFYVERGAQQDGGGGTWAAWGDVAATRFEGDAGGHAIDGDVVTGTAGLDRRWRALLVGLALSRSAGEGGYGTGAATIASTLTSVHPYMQVRLGERAELWGAAGWGRGGLEITPGSGAMLEADLTNRMGALGARAVLMGAGGLEIALRSDLLWTETSSDGTAALA